MRRETASLSSPIGRAFSGALGKCTETFAGAGLVWGTSNCPIILEAAKNSAEDEARPKTGETPVVRAEPATRRPTRVRKRVV